VKARADQASVAALLHQSRSLEIKSIVSTKPEKQSLFQVDSVTGTLVQIFASGREQAAFIIGKMGPSYSETYVRNASSSDVVLVNGALETQFKKPAKDWRDKAIVSLGSEIVTFVAFDYPGESFVVAQKDTAWAIGNRRVNNEAINSLVSSLLALQADDFIDATVSPTTKPVVTIAFGSERLTIAQKKGENTYSVHSALKSQWYQVNDWKIKPLLKHKKDF
jgi:hypothetical protein